MTNCCHITGDRIFRYPLRKKAFALRQKMWPRSSCQLFRRGATDVVPLFIPGGCVCLWLVSEIVRPKKKVINICSHATPALAMNLQSPFLIARIVPSSKGVRSQPRERPSGERWVLPLRTVQALSLDFGQWIKQGHSQAMSVSGVRV